MSIFVQLRPWRVGRHDEQRGPSDSDLAPGLIGAPDDEHRLRLVDAGDEHLLARQDPVAAVAAGGGGDAVASSTRRRVR